MPTHNLHDWHGLSADDAAELAAQVAELARAGLPLGPGLRAMAEEMPSGRLPRVLRSMADRVDAGIALDAAIEAEGRRIPIHLRGLLLAGVRSGRLTEVMEEFADLERAGLELRRRVRMSLSYPAVLAVMMAIIVVLANIFIVSGFEKMFRDFNMQLPRMTHMFLAMLGPGTYLMLAVLLIAASIPILLWVLPSAAWPIRVLHEVPMVGPILRNGRLAQFSRMMSLLLRQQVPLPDALRLAGQGVHDADLAKGSQRVAADVEAGQALSESLAARRQFPRILVPLVEWGQRAGSVAESFRAAAEMFEGQAQSQGRILEIALLPIVFLMIVIFVGVFITAMFLPMVGLIQLLSWL